jgi:rubredoxin
MNLLYWNSRQVISAVEVHDMKYVCNMCGWVYDEDEAGVKWEDLPDDFACEVCGVGKEDFSPEE